MSDIFTPPHNDQPNIPQADIQGAISAPIVPSKVDISALPLRHTTPSPMHIFSTYREIPEGVSFDTQEENETILLFLRRDFITNVPWITATVTLLLIPFLITLIFQLGSSPFSFLPPHFALIIQIFYYLIVISYAFVNFITWFFNISLVTDKRVIDVDFSELIYKNVAGTKLTLVQDVSFTQVGVIRSLFDFGDVLIQTAGAVDNFDFLAVPRPIKVVEIVEALIGKERRATP